MKTFEKSVSNILQRSLDNSLMLSIKKKFKLVTTNFVVKFIAGADIKCKGDEVKDFQ